MDQFGDTNVSGLADILSYMLIPGVGASHSDEGSFFKLSECVLEILSVSVAFCREFYDFFEKQTVPCQTLHGKDE